MHYNVPSLKGKEARHCNHSDGTSDFRASFIPREGSRLATTVETNSLNGEPLLVAFRCELVHGCLHRLHRLGAVGSGGEIVAAIPARFDVLEITVRTGGGGRGRRGRSAIKDRVRLVVEGRTCRLALRRDS